MSTYNPTQEFKVELAYFTKPFDDSSIQKQGNTRTVLLNLMDGDPNVTDDTRLDDWYNYYHNQFTAKWKPL